MLTVRLRVLRLRPHVPVAINTGDPCPCTLLQSSTQILPLGQHASGMILKLGGETAIYHEAVTDNVGRVR